MCAQYEEQIDSEIQINATVGDKIAPANQLQADNQKRADTLPQHLDLAHICTSNYHDTPTVAPSPSQMPGMYVLQLVLVVIHGCSAQLSNESKARLK